MNKRDIEDAVIFCAKEIAQAIFENEYMSKAHNDYNKERGKIATYDEIMDLIYNGDKEQTDESDN